MPPVAMISSADAPRLVEVDGVFADEQLTPMGLARELRDQVRSQARVDDAAGQRDVHGRLRVVAAERQPVEQLFLRIAPELVAVARPQLALARLELSEVPFGVELRGEPVHRDALPEGVRRFGVQGAHRLHDPKVVPLEVLVDLVERARIRPQLAGGRSGARVRRRASCDGSRSSRTSCNARARSTRARRRRGRRRRAPGGRRCRRRAGTRAVALHRSVRWRRR